MTVSLLVYSLVTGVLLAAGVWSVDRALRSLSLPTRWGWMVGMGLVAAAPLAGLARTPSAPARGMGEAFSPAHLYALLSVPPAADLPDPVLPPLPFPPLAGLWLLASLALLTAAAASTARLMRRQRAWRTVRVGVEEVLVSRDTGPAVLGWLRPRIVLPEWVLELTGDQVDLILLHEAEHRRARDPAVLLVGLILVALAPWNPVLWWMRGRLHLAVEGDCDRRVLGRGVAPAAYGRLLLSMASRVSSKPIPAPALAEARTSILERRLHMIRSHVQRHRWGWAALGLLSGAGLVVLACVTPTPPSETEEAEATAADTYQAVSTFTAQELAPAPEEVGEDGLFLVRRVDGQVEYLRPVAPEEAEALESGAYVRLKEVPSATEERTGASPEASEGFVVRKIAGDQEASAARETGTVQVRHPLAGLEDGPHPKPLIIVDGVIMASADESLWTRLAPEDIEKIEVIKGKAAEAMYGARARGGVIHITTKKD